MRQLLLLPPMLLLSLGDIRAQFNEGDFMLASGGSWKNKEYEVKETLDSELDIQIGYYPLPRMGVGLIGNWGLNRFSYAETNQVSGVTYTNFKEGNWGGIGPYIRGHLGLPEFSAFAQLHAVFGKVEQDSENNLTTGDYTYYREEGNFQQYSFSAGVWWYFTRRLGMEVMGTADWTSAQIRSGNVGSDGELTSYPAEHRDDTGGGVSVRLIYWFRLDGGAKKANQPAAPKDQPTP